MDKKYKFEFFQGSSVSGTNTAGGTSLSDAYKKGASVKNLISNTVVGSGEPETASNASASNVASAPEAQVAPQGAGIGNLWNFLGIDDLSMKQKRCVYNCGIDVFGCLERCSNPDCRQQENLAYDQCKFGCMRRGINCTTTCISEIKPEKVPPMFSSDFVEPTVTLPITNPSITEAVQLSTTSSIAEDPMNNFEIPPTEVHGVYDSLDTYAPFDMRVWPQEGKYGWTLSELARMKNAGYEAPNVIEVQMNHGLYPLKSDKPLMEFDYDKQ
jgi:hypothetical protein